MESSVISLTVPSAAELRGPFPSYHQPKEILSFSLDDERQVHYDDRGLSCYFPAPIGTCLFDRADTFKARDVTKNEHIDNILQALVHAKRSKTLPGFRQPQFVTFRGIMTKILYLPYNSREEWELGATRYNGTIYLEERLTERRLQEPFRNRQQKLLMYSGYRFETMSTVPVEPDQLSGADDPVVRDRSHLDTNNCAEFNSLFKTRLGKHSILMGAEVDCVSHGLHKKDRTDRYLELKTSRILTSRQGEENFERHKLLKFYLQSFLAGIPRIILGFRDDDGYLRQLQAFKTLEIPRLVRSKGFWEPVACFQFADRFLSWLTAHITVDDPTTSYTIRYTPQTKTVELIYLGHHENFLIPEFVSEFSTWPENPSAT